MRAKGDGGWARSMGHGAGIGVGISSNIPMPPQGRAVYTGSVDRPVGVLATRNRETPYRRVSQRAWIP